MGAWQLLQDLTVQSNTQSVVMNNFGTITKDDFIRIESTIVNNSTSTDIAVFANTATTQTQYHTQLLLSGGGTVAAVRTNTNRAIRSRASRTGTTFSYLKLSENDRLNIFSHYNMTTISTDIDNGFPYVTSSGATFPSGVTSLTFTADATNGLGTGSRIQIYKLAATKVADITVPTNSTQVNIPFPSGTFDPAIDKDSEYLLVSDLANSPENNSAYITYNDQTTLSGYYSQGLYAFASTVGAGRGNNSFAWYAENGRKAVIHTHIKLSNIGAFTAQNYSLRNAGTNEPMIQHSFISSIAENITSITKINIIAANTNAIAAGSRFTLYKLYE